MKGHSASLESIPLTRLALLATLSRKGRGQEVYPLAFITSRVSRVLRWTTE